MQEQRSIVKVRQGNIDEYLNFIYFEMIQRLKYILQCLLEFVAAASVKKIVYIITGKCIYH